MLSRPECAVLKYRDRCNILKHVCLQQRLQICCIPSSLGWELCKCNSTGQNTSLITAEVIRVEIFFRICIYKSVI